MIIMGVTKTPSPTLVTKLPPLDDPGDTITWRHTKTPSDLFFVCKHSLTTLPDQ